MVAVKLTDAKKFGHGTFDDGTFDAGTSDGGDCTGVLITNLGTPDSCRPGDVRRYLKEFLWDPRVVKIPRAVWWPVLHLVVLNTRPRKSARAYQKIWGKDGSPLLVISRQQQRKLQRKLAQGPGANSIKVELGMRYGNPSIAAAIANLQSAGVRRLLVLPLYPQYSTTTTASAFDAVRAALSSSRGQWTPALRMVNHYHDHPGYIAALAGGVRDYQKTYGGGEVLLMSFHGIPQAYSEAGDPYPHECRKTARLLAEELGLNAREWRVSFQSRFGPTQWLQPYTDHALISLARGGVRSVQVVCPGFSVDCLETLAEVAVENRDRFLAAGGENYGYIPCLNDGDEHIRALADIIIGNIGTGNIGDWIEEAANGRDEQNERGAAVGADV